MKLVLLMMLAACGGEAGVDSAAAAVGDTGQEGRTDSDEPEGKAGCEEVAIKVIGEEPPVVGDSWTLYLDCDGAVMTGTTVVRVDPADFATLADNVVTWTTAGTADLSVQVGSTRLVEEVTVGEAR